MTLSLLYLGQVRLQGGILTAEPQRAAKMPTGGTERGAACASKETRHEASCWMGRRKKSYGRDIVNANSQFNAIITLGHTAFGLPGGNTFLGFHPNP